LGYGPTPTVRNVPLEAKLSDKVSLDAELSVQTLALVASHNETILKANE